MVETFLHSASKCVRNDPPDWNVSATQVVAIALPFKAAEGVSLDVWRSCTGWRYPANDDGYMVKLPSITVSSAGTATLTAHRNCYYTLTTVRGVAKPPVPTSGAAQDPRPAFFPLPYSEDFEGTTAGGEAPYFGDQEGKWETVAAGGGRAGKASQQQLRVGAAWPILEPQCNDHGAPVSIIGDMFFESTRSVV